jgi:hypothetical protein
MKWLRICAMLIAVLAAMRVGSWAIGWIVAKSVRGRARVVAAAANLAAFGIFALLLVRDLAPGEPVDFGALVFGFVGVPGLLLDGLPLAALESGRVSYTAMRKP